MSTFKDPSANDVDAVGELLGRKAAGRFAVCLRRLDGRPVVIENEPHLRDGTPMPTLYWLVDRELHDAVSRIESEAGVHIFEELTDVAELELAHERYARRRTDAIVHTEFVAPVGGVGGTRVGVKCLHAHLANFLVTGEDPVGELIAARVALPEFILEIVR